MKGLKQNNIKQPSACNNFFLDKKETDRLSLQITRIIMWRPICRIKSNHYDHEDYRITKFWKMQSKCAQLLEVKPRMVSSESKKFLHLNSLCKSATHRGLNCREQFDSIIAQGNSFGSGFAAIRPKEKHVALKSIDEGSKLRATGPDRTPAEFQEREPDVRARGPTHTSLKLLLSNRNFVVKGF